MTRTTPRLGNDLRGKLAVIARHRQGHTAVAIAERRVSRYGPADIWTKSRPDECSAGALLRHRAAPAPEGAMRTRPFLNVILDDEALTRGLGDEEARLLVEWLAHWAEYLAEIGGTEDNVAVRVEQLRRRGRTIRQFVDLWCHRYEQGAALQLAATENCRWPTPDPYADPWELMHQILDYESHRLFAA